MNTGKEFLLEYRYSNLLTVVILTFMYSSGIPILYAIAAAFFII